MAPPLHLVIVLTIYVLVGPSFEQRVDVREYRQEQEIKESNFVGVADQDEQISGVDLKLVGTAEIRKSPCKTKRICREAGGECKEKGTCSGPSFPCSKKCDCCLPTPPASCIFGDIAWPNLAYLTETCIELQCRDGQWIYEQKFNEQCGMCNVTGDPHIGTYDSVIFGISSTHSYTLNRTGEYIITQPYFGIPALFDVRGNFEMCDSKPNYNKPGSYYYGSCIKNITYREPGITIKLGIGSAYVTDYCIENAVDPANDPECQIKVWVNDENRTISESVETFFGTDGAILVFKHNDITESDDLNCISIVGTKGLSISLCEERDEYPFLYVWAEPSLKSNQSQLYGLCNTYTGHIVNSFGLQNGSYIDANNCLNTWNPHGWYDICDEFSTSWQV